MNQESLKIGELFEKYSSNPEIIDEITKPKKKIFIKSESGKIVEIIGLIKKVRSHVLKITFTNGIELKCAYKHLIKKKMGDKYSLVFSEDLKIGDFIKTRNIDFEIQNIEDFGCDYVYDITMKEEFLYETKNGIIHHNSMLAIQALAGAQRKFKGDVIVAFLDSEEATTTQRLSNLGVRNPKIRPYNDITIEKVFKFIEGICLFKEEKGIIEKPTVMIWDSIANTLTQKERETEDINSVIGYKARVLSLLIPKYVAKLAIYNICLITVNQLRDLVQIGNFAPAKELKFLTQGKDVPGGNTLKFNAFHLLEMKVKDLTKEDVFGFDGFMAEVNCVKNKLFSPNIKFKIVGNFVTGFSNFWTNYVFLTSVKRLQTGAWGYLIDYPTKKWQGTKNAEALYNSDIDFRNAFDNNVKESIQIDIIDKHNPEVA